MLNLFFLLIELSMYGFSIYLLLYKDDEILFYLPVIFFAYFIINNVAPASVHYLLTSLLIGKLIYRHPTFLKHNIFAAALALLYLWLLKYSTDFVTIRPYIFSTVSLFICIPLTVAVYSKYTRPELFKNLYRSALIILVLFIMNVLVSTVSGYAPTEMYGITGGILFGNLFATFLNIIAFALFIILYRLVNQRRPLELIIFIISFFFILLSLRRSVMGLSALSVVVILLILVSKGKVSQVLSFVFLSVVTGAIVFFGTDFTQELIHRYELRKLDERALAEEKRFFEYEMLYNDTFVSYDYNPWIGYGLFDSPGNYGKGQFGPRSLHGDLTNIFHSSGFLGVFLYLAMFITLFVQAILRIRSITDLYIVGFCALAFTVYTITGRYTQIDNMLMLTLLVMLPLGKIRSKLPEAHKKPIEMSLQ